MNHESLKKEEVKQELSSYSSEDDQENEIDLLLREIRVHNEKIYGMQSRVVRHAFKTKNPLERLE